jgi:glycosyltransferase involved in cell wall biosynthesis
MRIAVVSGFPPDPYGEAHHSWEIFSSIARQFPDIQLLILAHKNNAAPDYSEVLPNLHIKRVTYPNSRLKSSISIFPLLKEILKFRPDIVHFQGTQTPRYGGLFGEPTTLLMIFLRLCRIPIVVTIHSLWLPSDLNDLWRRKGLNPLIAKMLSLYYKLNLRLISYTVSTMNLLTAGNNLRIGKEYQQAYCLRSDVIQFEIHPCKLQPVSEERKKEAKAALGLERYRTVVSVGFVRPDKGFHILLDCASGLLDKFPDLVIIIAGEPPKVNEYEYCENLLVRRNRLKNRDRIILRFEMLSDELFSRYIDAADIIVVPYLRSLGPSGIIHHGLGRGKPVVASAVGFNTGLDGVCLLVPPGDASALAQALDYLLSDETAYRQYCRRALDYAARWTWDDLARMYIKQYQNLITHTAIKL